MEKTITQEAANLAMDMAAYIFMENHEDLYFIVGEDQFQEITTRWVQNEFERFCHFKEIDKVKIS